MKKSTKRWLLFGLPGGLLAIFLLFIICLPGIARIITIRVLSGMGVYPADLRFTRISTGGTDIVGLTIGEDAGLSADSIKVEYTAGELFDGRIKSIAVSGASIDLKLKDGTVDIGFLAPIIAGEGGGKIPIDHASVDTGRIVITDGSFSRILPFECALDRKTAEGIFDVSLSCLPLENSRFTAGGSMSLDGGTPSGTIDIDLADVNLAGLAELVAAIPQLTKYSLKGVFSMAGPVNFGPDSPISNLTLRLKNIDLNQKEGDAGLEGLETDIVMTGMWPPSTAPGQRISIQTAFAGGLKTINTEVVFEIKNEDLILIDSLTAEWAGGTITAEDVTIRPSSMSVKAELKIEGVEIQQVIDALYPGRVEGEGRLYGHLPVQVTMSPRMKLSFGEGFLETRPSSGWIRIKPEDAQLLLGINRVVPLEQASTEEIPKLMVMQALQDFGYEILECRFSNEPDHGWVARINMAGKGPRGKNAIPVGGFVIENRNLDEVLNLFIFSYEMFRLQGVEKETQQPEKPGDDKVDEAMDDAMDMFF